MALGSLVIYRLSRSMTGNLPCIQQRALLLHCQTQPQPDREGTQKEASAKSPVSHFQSGDPGQAPPSFLLHPLTHFLVLPGNTLFASP